MRVGEGFILKRSEAGKLVQVLAEEMRIIAPRRNPFGDVMFGIVGSPQEVLWDYGHDIYPPKRFLFPHYEDLFRYQCNGRTVKIEREKEPPRQAILGIRSCDVSAIRFQEKFFGLPIQDPHFKARLDNTVLFSLVCNVPPKKECFCICCDGGPYLNRDFDVQLTDLGDRYLYEIGSEKGAQASQLLSGLLASTDPQDWEERRRIELQVDSQFETVAYMAKAINFISTNEVPEEVWEEVASTCFRCGACTNLCPVCTCFTVEDAGEGDGSYSRCRSWDSCQLSGFTREASGVNPRPTFGTRLQRRFYHKASYQYILRDGRHGCVGCGRCITACLTHLGVPEVIKKIRHKVHQHLEPQTKHPKV